MAGSCAVASPDDPLVRSLIGVTDCNVRVLVHAGYAALFQPSGAFVSLLTALLTVYVAFIGYRLLIGRAPMGVSDFVLNAVKLGAVLALATQWDTYQTLVYGFLFRGPQQLAGAMLGGAQAGGAVFSGDVFDGLQTVFDDLTTLAAGYASHAPSSVSPLLGGPASGAALLTGSATLLLLSSLGVLLAAKIVLGLLLSVGPVFIALLLFDSTRGLFEGWLRASLAFAFAPLATTLLLGVVLMMLEPSLLQVAELDRAKTYGLGPVYAVATLVTVFAGVSFGALVAGGAIAAGFRLPWLRFAAAAEPTVMRTHAPQLTPSRAVRTAAAVTSLDRRESLSSLVENRSSVRRITVPVSPANVPAEPARLGQENQRRANRPRVSRFSSDAAGRPKPPLSAR